jgi:AcrR family transcriptional regulator
MDQRQEPRRRTGGRSARVVRDVLEATLDELSRSGFAALTFEAVAGRARVSRTTLHRRWPSKQKLVGAALLCLAEVQPAARDTGTLRGDLVEFIRIRVGLESQRERFAGLLRANMTEVLNPELVALGRLVEAKLDQPIVSAVVRGIARGELPPGTDPQLIIAPVFTTVAFRAFVQRDNLDPGFAEQIVDVVLAGARTGAAVRRAVPDTVKPPGAGAS